MNICLITLCLTSFGLAVPACSVKADQKPVPAGRVRVASEKDVLGDWQTQGEGWRVKLNLDHTAAVYSEGYGEVGPFPATWKLVGNDVVISDVAPHMASLKSFLKYIDTDLMVIPYKSDFVLLPREELSAAEKYGFALAPCLWRIAQKHDSKKY